MQAVQERSEDGPSDGLLAIEARVSGREEPLCTTDILDTETDRDAASRKQMNEVDGLSRASEGQRVRSRLSRSVKGQTYTVQGVNDPGRIL